MGRKEKYKPAKQQDQDMKFIASLLASLTAQQVLAKDWFLDKKQAYCHYAQDYNDWTQPRMMFGLKQKGSDEDVKSFKIGMQAFNMGEKDDTLHINRFEEINCGGDATIVDGGIPVISFWGQTKAFYWSKLEETNMCDSVSMSLNNDKGE